ncbi:amidohydrolase [Sphingobium sufflavum]|uniref:amidohydrolase n=1 Tax=Sphingobium sufflavum TaxID=1129547 RepID=UPI001F3E49C2|nr:amidohydrolase [Sphingobium sufflavum]MCE7797567.1 amidohydrolase [Sphingobium sufflavum]
MRLMVGTMAVAAVIAMAAGAAPAAGPAGAQADARIAAEMPALMILYRDLHAHPELSLQEKATAAKLAALVRPLGFTVTEGVGGTGVVAVLKNGAGPVLLVRADMDGLPVVEKTGLPFASTVRATTRDGVESGVMHACGHDTHMAAWIGAARALAAMKDQWSGTLVMILQPAEEIGGGARAMIADGLFTRFPKPTHAIAFHDAANLEAGRIGYTPGFALANVDSVDLTVRGVGGHGAYPQTVKDPIVLASRIVTTLQTLVSREQEPQDPAVVTVGSFIGGAKHNIVPDEAKLLITVRSYSDATRQRLLDGIARIAKGEAIAAGVPEDRMPLMTVQDGYTAATFNTPDLAEEIGGVFRSHFGDVRVERAQASMGGEDFGQYVRADKSIRSLIFWVGGVPAARMAAARDGKATLPSLHSAYWAPDAEAVVGTGARALTVAALEILKKNP